MASVGGFFRGTSAGSDFRFGDSEKKLIKTMTFPSSFNEKVDVTKVNLDIMKTWIAKEIISILDNEDEVLIDMIFNMLSIDEKLDPKHIQITLTPFLSKSAPSFTEKLWNLLLSAQKDPMGIPIEFIEDRMKEIEKQREKESMTKERIQETIAQTKADLALRLTESKPVSNVEKKLLRRRSPSRSRSRSRNHLYRDRSYSLRRRSHSHNHHSRSYKRHDHHGHNHHTRHSHHRHDSSSGRSVSRSNSHSRSNSCKIDSFTENDVVREDDASKEWIDPRDRVSEKSDE